MLDRLEELCEKATRGPWSVEQETVRGIYDNNDKAVCFANCSQKANTDFIVEARNALPALIKRVREAEKVCHIVQKEREHFIKHDCASEQEFAEHAEKLCVIRMELWHALAEWEGR